MQNGQGADIDYDLPSDLPRFTAPEAHRVADFRKLRSVRIESGAICGDWPETTDADGYWNPLDAWYKNEAPPYMALVTCGTDDLSVTQFAEKHGPFGRDLSADHRKGIFSLVYFKLEQWRFHLALKLCRCSRGIDSPREAESLRKALLNAVEEAWDNVSRIESAASAGSVAAVRPSCLENAGSWRRVICEIADAARVSRFDDEGLRQPTILDTNWYQEVSAKIKSLDPQRLVYSVRFHLSRMFWEKLQPARFRLDFPDREAPRLALECGDLLATFYWMLAVDLDADRAPAICTSCKQFFVPKRRGAVYCSKEACKERGRRHLDWDRNRAKYNRNRRLKRRKKKQQRAMRGRKPKRTR